MKKILTLLAAVAFAGTALVAEAATPKAAEEPNATVISTDAPAPRAKPMKAKKSASKSTRKSTAAAKKAGTKKVVKKSARAGQRKAHSRRHV